MQRYDCSGVMGSLWMHKAWKKEREAVPCIWIGWMSITLGEAEVQGLINLQTHPERVRKPMSPLNPDAHMERIWLKSDLTYSRSHKTLYVTCNDKSQDDTCLFLGKHCFIKQCKEREVTWATQTTVISTATWNKLTETCVEVPLKVLAVFVSMYVLSLPPWLSLR